MQLGSRVLPRSEHLRSTPFAGVSRFFRLAFSDTTTLAPAAINTHPHYSNHRPILSFGFLHAYLRPLTVSSSEPPHSFHQLSFNSKSHSHSPAFQLQLPLPTESYCPCLVPVPSFSRALDRPCLTRIQGAVFDFSLAALSEAKSLPAVRDFGSVASTASV
ncbi:hypothetical protein VTJ04DRAFT_715 [Mycothermus thermophilus]|uniref:uncharacterized protein n=1 Tax=Humicola insolens TaxID=85995 RepID=UPI003743FD54